MNLKPAHPRPKSHLPNLAPKNLAAKNLSANATVGRSQMAKRRSNRMALHASVGLSGEDRQKCAFTMPAKATKLNKHGAAVQLRRELLVGSLVTVNNKQGAALSARVVAQLAALEGVSTYAIEFVEQGTRAETFWGIIFPPNTSNS
jgi:hypothetical protein